MSETIIVSILSLAGTLIGSLFGVLAASRLTNYRIGQLEKKVDKHNSVIERVYEIEKQEAVIKEEIEVANHRIADLEQFHK